MLDYVFKLGQCGTPSNSSGRGNTLDYVFKLGQCGSHANSSGRGNTLDYVFKLGQCIRGVNLYGLRVSLMDVCDLHRLTGVRCNPYGYL